ncbi:helix-turn-helix domain-containing protein [Collimonas sp. NPDC087041]|uniref:helix-turn-helix domain-containing protein n=1 Tax=Collimonas sp. NPDC087041 TaxID=3363960 RepID=UPI003827531F
MGWRKYIHLNGLNQGIFVHFNELCSGRLQEERIRLGLTQTEIANQIGIRGGMWGRYERNEAAPGGDVLKAFADVGGDVQYVLTGEKSSSALTDDEKEMLSGYRGLDVRGKAGVLALIDGMSVAPKAASGTKFSGNVSQVVDGDQTVNAPMTFHMTDKKKKKSTKE